MTNPVGEGLSKLPYMYVARRPMALPANTFSFSDSSTKSMGAITGTSPELTC